MKRMMRRMLAIIGTTILVLTVILTGLAEEQADTSSGWQNYILVLDNSGSNWSKVNPTDKDGLRYAAFTRLYNEMPIDNTSIGLIIFAGGNDENCQRFGPVERNTQEADELIYETLQKKSSEHKSDMYTDITFALKAAENMTEDMPDGDTTIILVTDGVNDLTNSSHPLTDPENIQANEDTVKQVARLVDMGNRFYVVGLTAGGNDSSFMDFVEKMGAAGGGIEGNGDYGKQKLSNVYEATKDNIGEIVSNILSENTNNERIEEKNLPTPVDKEYTVRAGVDDVSITISFDVGDKPNLNEVVLVEPEPVKTEHLVWKDGNIIPVDDDSISVQEDQNYINVRILNPTPGRWGIKVKANKDGISVNNTIVQNKSVMVRVEAPDTVYAGEKFEVRAYLMEYVNDTYQDMTDEEFYASSTATIRLTDPSGAFMPINMKADRASLVADVVLPSEGIWKAAVFVSNDYMSREVPDKQIEVIAPPATEAPTAEPTAVPTAVPVTPAPIGNITIAVAPEMDERGEDGQLTYIRKDADELQVSVSSEGEYESCWIEICKEGDVVPSFKGSVPELRYPIQEMEAGAPYIIRATLKQADGTEKSEERRVAIYPDPSKIVGFDFSASNIMETRQDGVLVTNDNGTELTYSVQSGDVDKVICIVSEDGKEINRKEFRGKKCKVDLKEGSVYTVKAIPVPKYGTGADGEQYAAQKSFTPKVYTFMEKLVKRLPLIGGIVGGLLALIAIALIVFNALRKKLKGTIHMSISAGNIVQDDFFVLLTGVPSGKKLTDVKAFKTEHSAKPWYSAVGAMTLCQERTDVDGKVIGDTAGGNYVPNTDVLKVLIAAAGQFLMDSNNTTVEFEVSTDEGGYKVKCCYSSDNEYPSFTQTAAPHTDMWGF